MRDDMVVLMDTPDLMMIFQCNSILQAQSLGWQPLRCSVSPTLEYLVVSSSLGNYVELWHIEDWKLGLTLAGPAHLTMTMLQPMPGFEVTIFSRLPGTLTGVAVASGETICHYDLSAEGVSFLQIVALEDGDSFAALCQSHGHRFVVQESLQRIMSDPSSLRRRIEHARGRDQQHFDMIGIASGGRVVGYQRDKRGIDGGAAVVVFNADAERNGVHMRVPYVQPMDKGALLMATETTLIVGHAEYIDAIALCNDDRQQSEKNAVVIPARGFSFDIHAQRLALIDADGDVFTIDIAAPQGTP